MSFDIEDAIRVANQAATSQGSRNLNDLETQVLQGVLEKLDYDQIAIQTNYATSYISQDVAPKLWKLLSAALGEKVRKGNCKTALQRYAEQTVTSQVIALDGSQRLPFTLPTIPPSGTADPNHLLTNSSTLSRLDLSQSDQNDLGQTGLTPIYIERSTTERQCYEALLQPGALVRLKAPRFMGKTTLISHVLAQLPPEDYRVVQLSLEMADRSVHFADLNRFLRWFCFNISRELSLPNLINEYWEEAEMGAKVSCTAYVEESLLAQDPRPLVLCLDNVDCVFPYPAIYEDFFGLLRSWYEKARTRETWSKLRLLIVHATDVYTRLQLHQSPFNVGFPLELPEFTPQQVQQLAASYRIHLDDGLNRLILLVGGHPALLKQTFEYLNAHSEKKLQDVLDEATTESSIFGHHLREQLLTLQNAPELAQAFRQIVTSDLPIALPPIPAYQLQSMGLIQLSGNRARTRCKLYHHYFRERLS